MTVSTFPASTKPRSSRKLSRIAGAVLLLAMVGVLGSWAYNTTRPDYRLRLGMNALREGEEGEEGWLPPLRYCFAYAGLPPETKQEKAERLIQLLEANDHGFQAHLLHAQLAFTSGHFEKALEETNALYPYLNLGEPKKNSSLMQPNTDLHLEAVVLAGMCLLHLDEHRAAERNFRYALDNWPRDLDPRRGKINAHKGLFTIYYDQGAVSEAVVHLKSWAKLEPDDGRPLRTAGFIYKTIIKDDAQAIEFLTKALRCRLASKTSNEVHVELAELYIKGGQFDEAMQALDSVPLNPLVLALRARCLASKDRSAEARQLLAQALEVQPRNLEALRLMAEMRLEAKEPEEAAKYLKRALEAEPNDLHILNLLAGVYEKLRDRQEADKIRMRIKKTLELYQEMSDLTQQAMKDPWDSSVRLRMAEVAEQLHNPELAAMWKRAAKAGAGVPVPGR